jgi:predicted nuclease of predicted toxin-antitoxin system
LIIWIDAQVSPVIAPWLTATFRIESHAVRELGLHRVKDSQIFQAARDANVVVMTKDSDFISLLDRFGLRHKFCGLPAVTHPTHI